MNLKLFIIDAASPFFIKNKIDIINWSKIPYSHLEKNGKFPKKNHKKIKSNFIKFIDRICEMGYNAITIDDLSHLVIYDFYHDKLSNKINIYRSYFQKLFEIAKQNNLKIFITTDIMFYNQAIREYAGKNDQKIVQLLKIAVKQIFNDFKKVDGIVFRIGESDGVDIKGDFKSNLVIKTPEQANYYIRELLPIFEKNNKYFIFRTWTTGAYPVGDLLWNKKTYARMFANIKSDHFIISMKYGEADFFRYLKTSELFSFSGHNKIIELQARREYEGFGEFPSFIGWYYKSLYNKLVDNPSICGINVWCQTGGWSSFHNLTFLRKTSLWNELNTYTAIKIFKENESVKKILKDFFPDKNSRLLVKFFRYSDEIINELLYDPGFAVNKLYFNRVRIPPIMHIFWDNVTVSNLIIAIYSLYSKDKKISIMKGFNCLKKIKKMNKINKILNLSYNYKFHYQTFKIIALLRNFIYSTTSQAENLLILKKMIFNYHLQYPLGYKFYLTVKKKKKNYILKFLIRLLLRKKHSYRIIDKLIFNPFTSKILILFYKILRRNFPEFLGNQAMPFSSFLK